MHVTFCENFVVQEFKRNLYITLAKYLGQEKIAWNELTQRKAYNELRQGNA